MAEDQPIIFISYARSDVNFAWQITHTLQQVGAKVWLDVKDIPSGANWSTAIQNGLDTSTLMILILTPESMKSENVANEWQYYFDDKKPIIPILFQKVEKLHFQLRRIQWIDFYEQPFAASFQKLCDELTHKGVILKSLTSDDKSPTTTNTSDYPQKVNFKPRGHSAQALAKLAAIVENFLTAMGLAPTQTRLEVDAGYGWSFRRGSAIIEIYVTQQEGDEGYFQVLSPILHLPEEENRPPLYLRLLELNLQLSGSAFGIYQDVVYIFTERPLAGLDSVEAQNIITLVSSYADELDSQLVNEFGGRLYTQST